VDQHLQKYSLQKVTYSNLETAKNFSYSLLDDYGIVLQL
jgi:hypothetical protein